MVIPSLWTALSASARGASHERNDQKNQDAARVRPPRVGSDFLLLAVSDGHGNTRSFRSDRGSALAAEAALGVLANWIRKLGPRPSFSRVRRQARQWLPKAMIESWKSAVRADLATHPFTPFDFAAWPDKPPVIKPGEDLPVTAYLAYGATLLTVAITPCFVLYIQLGDGDIITVHADGRVTRPLPRHHELRANQTISLCSQNAWREFQVVVKPVGSVAPALVMLSTDGYANCFDNDNDFFQVGADLLAYLREQGVGYVDGQLAEWLRQSSHDGSGDDITVGLAARRSALRPHPPAPLAIDMP
ncbi:MAG: protein phosphatase 2C domain-containing protein [Methylacidiphilales bacterium]|nr:protein phosphatase 2C domain-containing protein [Candidatus Methylacidiphilales bacterium]